MKKFALALLLALGFAVPALAAAPAPAPAPAPAADPQNTLYMDLKYGRVVILMRPDLAPKHVARIKELVRDGFYDGLTFHRVIPGFMAQGGDPQGDGSGGSGQKIPAEFSKQPFVRGMVGMARLPDDVNSGDSQFFIMLADTPSLNGNYTVWGQVISGMEFVDALHAGNPPAYPDRIIRMRIAADVDKRQ